MKITEPLETYKMERWSMAHKWLHWLMRFRVLYTGCTMIQNPKRIIRGLNTGVFRQRGITLPFQSQPEFQSSR